MLDWFEGDAPWKLKITSFYEQYEFSLLDVGLPTEFAPLCANDTLSYLRREVGTLFHTALAHPVNITVYSFYQQARSEA